MTWTADGKEDFERCERVLKAHSAYRETRSSDGVMAVEGHDPDDTVVMITYPGPDQVPVRRAAGAHLRLVAAARRGRVRRACGAGPASPGLLRLVRPAGTTAIAVPAAPAAVFVPDAGRPE